MCPFSLSTSIYSITWLKHLYISSKPWSFRSMWMNMDRRRRSRTVCVWSAKMSERDKKIQTEPVQSWIMALIKVCESLWILLRDHSCNIRPVNVSRSGVIEIINRVLFHTAATVSLLCSGQWGCPEILWRFTHAKVGWSFPVILQVVKLVG